MAKLLSTGIYGFISSAKQTVEGWVSTFVSGVSGWIIKHNGDAEFKSIYARDKIVTNEYVYNRIRVTEDEEVITSNGKILSAVANGDDTYTVTLDLREGDVNPFADGDLLQGYYHNPENSGVIYAIQKMTVQADPDTTNQTMVVTCEQDTIPYPYMIIVRVGNVTDTERQSFIKISSRTNCQYFFDGINSFAALDNADNVKCVVGKADMGLIPAWAASIIGNVAKWFGLIADGVILRGTLVLKSTGTTVEDEFDTVADRIVDVETAFEIREGQISSKVTEAEVYAKNAKDSADVATQKASETVQTAEGFQTTVTETTQQAVSDAVAGANEAIEEKVSTQVTQSAKQWKVEVMGADADGNPNTVLAAINADESGVKISADKIQIDGTLIAQAILASGLNINNKLVIGENGGTIRINAGLISNWVNNGGISSTGEIPAFDYWSLLDYSNSIMLSNISSSDSQTYILPTGTEYKGVTIRIYNNGHAYDDSGWTPRKFQLAYKINGAKQNFIGAFTGTDLTLELDQMAVLTYILDINRPNAAKWYVERYG